MKLALPLPQSIRAQLTVLVIVIALPIVAITGIEYAYRIADRTKLAEQSAYELASATAAALAQVIDFQRTTLAALAARPAQRVERPAVCDPLLAEARSLDPLRANIAVSALSGDVVCSAVPVPAGASVSVLDMDHIRRLLRTGEFSVGEPFVGPITGRWVVPMTMPRRDAEGRLIGWIGAPLEVERMSNFLSRLATHQSGVMTIISPQGRVISRSVEPEKWVGTDVRAGPFPRALLDGNLSAWEGKGLEGTARIWGAAEVPGAGWKVLAGITKDELLAPVNSALVRTGVLYGVATMLVALLIYWITRSIIAPVRDLVETTRRIGAGDRLARARADGPREIAGIANELNHMLDALDRADTERMHAHENVRRSEEVLRLFVEHAPAAIAMFDREMKYIVASRRYLVDYGLSEASIIGRSHYEVFPELPERWKEIHRRCLAGAVERCDEDSFPRADGSLDWVRWEIRPCTDSSGGIFGIILFSEVITERKRAEMALRESAVRTRLLGSVANIALWDWNLVTNEVYYSPEWKRQLGYADQELPSRYEEWEGRLHPEDRAPALAAVKDHVEGSRTGYDVEFRLRHKDGQWRSILARAEMIRDAAGKPVRMMGCHVDVTERKRAEAAFRESETKLRNLIDGLGPSMFVGLLTPDGVILEANRPALAAAGLALEDVIGRPVDESYWFAWSEAVQHELRAKIGRATAGEPSRFDVQVRVAEGRTAWLDFSLQPLRDDAGRIVYVVLSAMVIDDRKRAEEALRDNTVRLKALTNRLLEVQEMERRALARELHDEVGGVLTAVKLNLQALARRHKGEAALEDGLALVDGAIQAVRSLSLDLRPSVLDDLGLIPALRWYCEGQAQRAGIAIELALDAVDLKAAPQLESACFRIVQEAVTNALRHAEPGGIRVALHRDDGSFELEIADDGGGFDVAAAHARSLAGQSAGLLGMEERVALLGGRFTVDSAPGKGTRVCAAFTLPGGEGA